MAFAETVKALGVTPELIVSTSRTLEKRNADQSKLALARRAAARSGKKVAEAGIAKPKLGRGVTLKSVQLAIAGQPQSRLVRGKLLRAVNSLAKHKKQKPTDVIALFGEAKRQRGEVVGKK